VRVESRWLDGEPFMPPEYAMTCNLGQMATDPLRVDQSRKREVIMPTSERALIAPAIRRAPRR
jgi:hypothetical protein